MNNITARAQPSVAVFSPDKETHACAVIRIIAPLLAQNWQVIWAANQNHLSPWYDLDAARRADLIIIQRHFPSVSTAKILRKIIGLKIPLVYDLDDMFLDVPASHPNYQRLKGHSPYIKWILNEADLITVSTEGLQNSLQKHTPRPIRVKPNLVDWGLFAAQPRPANDQFNFLISGTPTHRKDWALIEEPLLEVLHKHPNVNAVFFGELPKRFSNCASARFIDFQRDYQRYASSLKKLDVHAALTPLEDTPFNRCKSNIKWLEYSAAGIAGIFSDMAPYSSSVRNGETGLLVKDSADAWLMSMEHLLANPSATSAMVENARQEVFGRYSVENGSGQFVEAFQGLLGQPHEPSLLSELPKFANRLQARTHEVLDISAFLDKYVLWRFNRK
ncbi:glycosyltransferase family protein [Methylovulum miyakonense]|uniref:glycosyltransferase n=1 Tax=Methylovulum miyakonense TaxID=645578 RepID=UPI0003A7C9C5|nr:glycosyltransferase [Methylovulum miyakonense]